MKILFIGYAVNEKLANGLSGASIAGNKMQIGLIKELYLNETINLEIITVYPVATFPKEKKIAFKSKKIKLFDNCYSYRIGFINLPIIKQISQIVSVYKCAKKITNRSTIVFTYNMFPQVGIPAILLKMRKGVKICSLLADLPVNDNKNMNIIKRTMRKGFELLTKKSIRKIDKLIVLNKKAAEVFAPSVPYIVMEGGVDKEKVKPPKKYIDRKYNLVYCGSLTEYSGIMQLIEAMSMIKNRKIVLDIYGSGYLENEIIKLSKKSSNVSFFGKISNENILEIQRSAHILINPRDINDEISKLTFPSKMFEYLTSGTPVMCTKINGLNDEYGKYLYEIKNNTPKEIAEAIDCVLKMDYEELLKKAYDAYLFIVSEKTWYKQTRRIVKFLLEEVK